MQNTFNYLTVYTVPDASANAIVAALQRGPWLKATTQNRDIASVLFGKSTESAMQEYVPHALLGPDLIGIVEEADDEDDGDDASAYAYENLFTLDVDSDLAASRMAKLRQHAGYATEWTIVHVLGEEYVEQVAADTPEDETQTLHAGWLAVCNTPAGCIIANMISDPFIFQTSDGLTSTRPTDAYEYLVGGTDTLVQIFLQACGITAPQSLQRSLTLIGYSDRNSYCNESLVQLAINCSTLQNAQNNGRSHGFGITVHRLYQFLRPAWPHLTQSSPDLYAAPLYLPVQFVSFDVDNWCTALADEQMTLDSSGDREEVEALLGDNLELIDEEYGGEPAAILVVGLDPTALRGVAIDESPDPSVPDASKTVLTSIFAPIFGCDFNTIALLCSYSITSDVHESFRENAPDWYLNDRFNHVVPVDAGDYRVVLPLDGANPVTLTINTRVVPPYVGLGILPRLLDNPVYDDTLLLSAESFA